MKNQMIALIVKQMGVMMKAMLLPSWGMMARPVVKAPAVPEIS
jgi:hypothetical protein